MLSLAVDLKNELTELRIAKIVVQNHDNSWERTVKNIAYQIDSVKQQIEVPSQEPLFLENQAFIDRCLKKSNLKVPDLKSSIEVMKVANKVINFKLWKKDH